jgi:hypothetical protein
VECLFRCQRNGASDNIMVCASLVALVLYRIDPHLGAMVGASGDGKVGAIKSLSALSEVSGSAPRADGILARSL